jgi:hypothetical protein
VVTGLALAILAIVALNRAPGEAKNADDESAVAPARIYGIFIGVSRYGGRLSDLLYTDRDALRVRDALVRGAGVRAEDTVALVDAEATSEAVAAALRQIASEMRPDDTLVFFFSGHGNRVARAAGSDAADPDGVDETIELYDTSLRDDELKEAFQEVPGRALLVVLDSCFSGGFAKDLISVPGRMGLFSSEEDVTSLVARDLGAGGYLARFFEQAVGEHEADADRDRLLTAFELSQYIRERYRRDVTTKGADDYVSAGRERSYQHLVVDRGAIAPAMVLFELTGVRVTEQGRERVNDLDAFREPTVPGRWNTLPAVEFGDDSSPWARDGECDDPRFEGEGMAAFTVPASLHHDAFDCRTLFGQGRIRLKN